MPNIELCPRCNAPLNNLEEIHAVEGALYCSKECAISTYKNVVINTLDSSAEEWYYSNAEIISPEDIGAVTYLTAEQIYDVFKRLAAGSGIYQRHLSSLLSLEEHERKSILEHYASHNLKDAVDLILFMEG